MGILIINIKIVFFYKKVLDGSINFCAKISVLVSSRKTVADLRKKLLKKFVVKEFLSNKISSEKEFGLFYKIPGDDWIQSLFSFFKNIISYF